LKENRNAGTKLRLR